MENKLLLKANFKRHKGALFGIFILTLLVAAALGTVLTVWTNSENYIQSELDRSGYGELTAWVENLSDLAGLKNRIEALDEIERVEMQSLIYSNYTANEMESDSEGQLITYIPAENRYRFFSDDLSGYTQQPESILPGEVYVSPSMVSMFGIKPGDEITFPIARAGKNLTLTVRGFYEDVFMGSSMIGMKGFLISEADRMTALDFIHNAGIDALARDGAMLHIFPAEESGLTVSELNSLLNEQTALAEYTESVHSKDAIAGFMLILQNAFSGILLAFVLVLLFNGISYMANVIDQPERFHMLEGRTCTADNEIVITEFIAADFGIAIGDPVTVRGDSGSGEYIVSGIYSCANDMGDNFGMNREGYLKIGRDHPNLWCWHYFPADSSRKGAIAEALESAYGGDIHIHENTWPGLFGIISAMHALLVLMYALVIVFILIVTVMTGSKILLAEQKDLGIYKAIGFSSAGLRLTFALRFAMVAVPGGLLGTLLAAVITDRIVSSVMKLAGISNFVSHPDSTGLILPMVVVTLLFTVFGGLLAGKIKKYRLLC